MMNKSLVVGVTVFASAFLLTSVRAESYKPCDRFNSDDRDTCITTQGVVLKRLQGGWLDTESGLVWHEERKMGVNQVDAEAFCTQQTFRLPTGYPEMLNGYGLLPNQDSEITAAFKHGLFEVIERGQRRNFWASTQYPDDADYAFAALIGHMTVGEWPEQALQPTLTFDFGFRTFAEEMTALCVSAQPQPQPTSTTHPK